MHFMGIDLAWGTRQPSGVAVLDHEGRLVHVSAHRTDEEIAAALSRYDGPCLVGVDAPLVVTNPHGQRPCERALSADFARFQAGTHPSNTAKPEFRDGPRGARLAARLGLELEPAGGERRAIEVYPHAATVALFGLDRTLKYKNKPGRTLDSLQAALLRLVGLLEGLRSADPALVLDGPEWRRLVSNAEAAARKSQLRVVEDQVDAVVCAYVAAYAELRPESTVSYGDPGTGVIVTPALGGPPRT